MPCAQETGGESPGCRHQAPQWSAADAASHKASLLPAKISSSTLESTAEPGGPHPGWTRQQPGGVPATACHRQRRGGSGGGGRSGGGAAHHEDVAHCPPQGVYRACALRRQNVRLIKGSPPTLLHFLARICCCSRFAPRSQTAFYSNSLYTVPKRFGAACGRRRRQSECAT